MFLIWNDTDKLLATNTSFRTYKEAEDEIVRLRDSFRKQGYYRTNTWAKIAPEDIKYIIIEKKELNSFIKNSL
jgi:hypothetical protein